MYISGKFPITLFYKTVLILMILRVETFEPGFSNLKMGVVEKLRKTGYIEGDFTIGALFPIHAPPKTIEDWDPLECDAIVGGEGIELVEAAFFAVDNINNDKDFLPNIRLGIGIKDDCNSELVALYQTIKIIEEPEILVDKLVCGGNETPLIGMIGSASGNGEFQAENLLKLFKIPQIGYSTSSTELKQPYFYLSVAPSEYHQAQLIIKILKKFDWRYISIAYSDGHYGMNGKYFLEQWVSYYNICVFTSIYVSPPDKERFMFAYSVKLLFQDERAKVIVCFCDETALAAIFQEIRKLNLVGKFLILASNNWPIPESFLNDYKEEAEGSLMLSVRTIQIPEFDQYFLSRNLQNNERNPWFKEYWDLNHNLCREDHEQQNSSHQCSSIDDEDSGMSENYTQNAKVAYVIQSIQAFAYGLKKMYHDTCTSVENCPEFSQTFDTTKYMEYLTNLTFPFYGEEVNFQFDGSPFIGRFDIYNFQHNEDSYRYVKIGEYNCHHVYEKEDYDEENFLKNLNIFGNLRYPKNETFFQSICSQPCPPDHVQVNNSEILCCWSCIPCAEAEIINNKGKCQACAHGFWPNINKTACEEIPKTYTKWTDATSLIILGISILLIVSTLITFYIFIKYRHTPVLQATYRELHYIILCGIITMNLSNFVFIMKPTHIVCPSARIIFIFGVDMVCIPIGMMAVQIARIYDESKKQHPNFNSRCTSSRARLISTVVFLLPIIMLQLWESILIEWPFPTEIVQKDPKIQSYLTCKFSSMSWISYVLSLFDLLIIYYAVKIRKITNNFNEAKFLCVFIFIQQANNIAFRIIYAASRFHDVSLIIWITLDTFLILLFLFSPKLYIILRRPEKNTCHNFKPLGPQYLTY